MALTTFLSKLNNNGLSDVPPSDRIKQDINNKGLGVTKKVKQVFNTTEDGLEISRRKEAEKATEFKYCILVKKSAFGHDAWEEFVTCNYISPVFLLSNSNFFVLIQVSYDVNLQDH